MTRFSGACRVPASACCGERSRLERASPAAAHQDVTIDPVASAGGGDEALLRNRMTSRSAASLCRAIPIRRGQCVADATVDAAALRSYPNRYELDDSRGSGT